MCFSAVKLFKTPAASRLQLTCFKHWQGTKHESCMFAIAGRQQQAGDSFLLAEALSDLSSQQKEPSRLSSAKAFVHNEACSLNNATLQKNCKELKPLPNCSFQARKAFKTTGLFSFAFLTKQAVASCFTSWLSSWQAGLSQSAQWACWPCSWGQPLAAEWLLCWTLPDRKGRAWSAAHAPRSPLDCRGIGSSIRHAASPSKPGWAPQWQGSTKTAHCCHC